MPVFSRVSKVRLLTCDERLQALFNEVIRERDCMIVCGFRNEVEQNKAFEMGFSRKRWPEGAHNRLPSLAVDVLPAPYKWDDIEAFKEFGAFVKGVAFEKRLIKGLKWGGDWEAFRDWPHWEVEPQVPLAPLPLRFVSTFDTIGLRPIGVGA